MASPGALEIFGLKLEPAACFSRKLCNVQMDNGEMVNSTWENKSGLMTMVDSLSESNKYLLCSKHHNAIQEHTVTTSMWYWDLFY